MGVLVNAKATNVAAVLVAAVIIGLNVFLLVQTFPSRNRRTARVVTTCKSDQPDGARSSAKISSRGDPAPGRPMTDQQAKNRAPASSRRMPVDGPPGGDAA